MNSPYKDFDDAMSWEGSAYREEDGRFCEEFPSIVNSFGVWERVTFGLKARSFFAYPVPHLEIWLGFTSILWLLFDILFKKLHLRMPKVTSMLLAGAVVGLSKYLRSDSLFIYFFIPDSLVLMDITQTIGQFGFTFFWFLKGVTMDVGMLKKTGLRAGVIGVTTILVPLIASFLIFRKSLGLGMATLSSTEFKMISFVESLSTFTGINMLLKDLKINHSEFGRIAQASAMVADLVAFIMTFASYMYWQREKGVYKTLGVIVFCIAVFYVVRPVMFWVVRRTAEGRPVKDVYIYAVVLLVWLSHKYWESFNVFGSAGAFILGLAIPDGPPLGSAFMQKFESFNLGIFLPLYGAISMIPVDIPWFFKHFKDDLGIYWQGLSKKGKQIGTPQLDVLFIILQLFLMKFLSTLISAFATNMPLTDSGVLALVLNYKGIFELAYYIVYSEREGLSPGMFNIVAVCIFLNSLIMPIAIDFLYKKSRRFTSYRKRNMLNLKPESELPVLVCIHKPDHIKSMIDVLKTFHPSESSPLACHVLHLIELVGQATPTFVSHQMQRPEDGSMSCSDNVIVSFRHLHQNFAGSMSVNLFTSISFAEHLHEDICWLALDKSMYLILLPFHRTWSLDRSTVVSEDDTIRNLNLNVLKRAPCSVGVLVNRNPIWDPKNITESHCRVCLVFVGGKDDREALAVTNRMRLENPQQIRLTFLRFIPESSKGKVDEYEETLASLDAEEIMRNNDESGVGDCDSVEYIKRKVADGVEMSFILRSMAYDYDLFIVGRRSGMATDVTKGIEEWIEFEELGGIGDLLASPDYPSKASVLVVQRQEYVSNR